MEKTSNGGRTCKSCRHSEPVALRPDMVECREVPPVGISSPAGALFTFPHVRADAWCSHWQAKLNGAESPLVGTGEGGR